VKDEVEEGTCRIYKRNGKGVQNGGENMKVQSE